jgi:hypothetical protein
MRAHAVCPVKVEEGRVAPALRRRPCLELDEGLGQLGVVAFQAGLPVPTLHNNDTINLANGLKVLVLQGGKSPVFL